MIKFCCKHCGQQIGVPVGSGGGEARCPKCKNIVVVPESGSAEPVADQSNVSETKGGAKYAGFDHALFDIPPEDESASHVSNQGGMSKEEFEELRRSKEGLEKYQEEQIGKRKLPFFIDVFLYPLSFWGLVNIGIFIGVTSFLAEVGKILPGILFCLFWLLTLVIKVVAYLFIYWYFAECVRDSAEGGLRAPNVRGDVPGAVDMFLQMVNIIGCLLIFFMPFFIYVLAARRIDAIFWLLLVYGIFFFPMALLAIVVHNSPVGLNPRLLYRSISNTLRQYFKLVLLFVAAVLLIGMLGQKAGESGYMSFIIRCASIYLVFVAGHLLGRFYWKYQEKLKWEVSL